MDRRELARMRLIGIHMSKVSDEGLLWLSRSIADLITVRSQKKGQADAATALMHQLATQSRESALGQMAQHGLPHSGMFGALGNMFRGGGQ